MNAFTYAYGYRTREAAELAIIDDISSDFLSWCMNPRVAAYRTKDGRKRYCIVLDA
jgi:hypothetical protein